jgi:hypothetical protein
MQFIYNKETNNDLDYQLTKSVPLETSHPPISWLKASARLNIPLYMMNRRNEQNRLES